MGIFPNLGATPVLMRSWLGQDEIWFLAYSQPRLRWPVSPRSRAATSAGGSYHVVDSVVCEESAVIDTHINKQPLNRVTAIFADSSLSFLLPQGATLEHIADCVDDLGVRRERAVIAVVVKFAAKALQGPAPKLATVSHRVASRTAPASSVCQLHGS